MKILQLLPEVNEGGVERGTVELSRELVKLGHESVVISAGGKLVEQIELDGAKHLTFDVCSKNIITVPFRILKLNKLLKELKPDIIHVRSRLPAWLAYFANRSLHFPFITTVHGFNSVSSYSKIMTKGNKIICVSNAIKDYIQIHYEIDEKKIIVIPRGIDIIKFNPSNVDIDFIKRFKKKYKLHDKFVVTSVGRITQLKDLETFITAISELKQKYNNILALIVGGVREDKKHYFEFLNNLIRDINLEENIIFTGSQTHVAEIYTLSDVVVSSSKKPESFGRSVAEAIAMNTPVVATNHGGVLDIIDVGITGYLFESTQAHSLVQSIQKAKSLSFDGYNIISNRFSLQEMVDKTMSVYLKEKNNDSIFISP